MAKHIAVAGKGGVGKTTLTALIIRYLIEEKKGSILAVDADPNSNLNEALGLQVATMIADILDEVKDPKAVPPGMTKELFMDYKISQALVETRDVDLLVMGGPQGPGCYCYPTDLLRKNIENLSGNYDYLVIDTEAGLEHISRRTIPHITHLFVVSDNSARGVRSAGRVKQLVQSLKTPVEHIYLVITKVGPEGTEPLAEEIAATGLPLIGTIPLDPQVTEYDVQGKPLFLLPPDSAAVQAARKIAQLANI